MPHARLCATRRSGKPHSGDVARRNLAHQLEQRRLAREMEVKAASGGPDAGTIGVHYGKAVRNKTEWLGFPNQSSITGTLRRMRIGFFGRGLALAEFKNDLRAALASWASSWRLKNAQMFLIPG